MRDESTVDVRDLLDKIRREEGVEVRLDCKAYGAEQVILSLAEQEERKAARGMMTSGRITGERRLPDPPKYQKPAERPEPMPLKARRKRLAKLLSRPPRPTT